MFSYVYLIYMFMVSKIISKTLINQAPVSALSASPQQDNSRDNERDSGLKILCPAGWVKTQQIVC